MVGAFVLVLPTAGVLWGVRGLNYTSEKQMKEVNDVL